MCSSVKVRILCLSSFLLLIFGCGPAKPPDLVPTTISIQYDMPNISVVEGYPEIQTKDDVVISIIPQRFERTVRTRYELEWLRSRIGELLDAVETEQEPDMVLTYNASEIPYAVVAPDRLIFKMTVHNNLSRVLRLAGSVIAMQIDGKNVSLNTSDTKTITDSFVLPRQEIVHTFYGPSVSSLPRKCNIAFFIYDIITNVDDAGNPTRKANFEWFFTYENAGQIEDATISKKIMKMTRIEAAAMRARR